MLAVLVLPKNELERFVPLGDGGGGVWVLPEALLYLDVVIEIGDGIRAAGAI
jgi:hypothetical protein